MGFGFPRLAWTVAIYAVAMAYLESAVVVYLQRALSITPSTLIPLRDPATLGGLGSIEVGREVATIVMLAAVGWLAGHTSLERLAWTSVAFGIWDIGYHFWLWAYIGWPTSFGTNAREHCTDLFRPCRYYQFHFGRRKYSKGWDALFLYLASIWSRYRRSVFGGCYSP